MANGLTAKTSEVLLTTKFSRGRENQAWVMDKDSLYQGRKPSGSRAVATSVDPLAAHILACVSNCSIDDAAV